MQAIIKKVGILLEALPYIRAFKGKIFVIKYGGSILNNFSVRKRVLEDIVFLSTVGIKPVLVYGAGFRITKTMEKRGRRAEFIDGLRVTDRETLKIVKWELAKVGKGLVEEINRRGGKAKLFSHREGLIKARKKLLEKDLGFVGEVIGINKSLLDKFLNFGLIPVISPLGRGTHGKVFNINADEVSSKLSIFLKAEKLVLFTDVAGIMKNPKSKDSLISTLKVNEAKRLIKKRIIQIGMIPKINSAISAIREGVKKVHIIGAHLPHALLLEIFTRKGIGTQIVK